MPLRGVYAITLNIDDINGAKVYIGKSVNVRKRWKQHTTKLQNAVHHSVLLQRAWDKYGAESFTFSMLEETDDVARMSALEQKWLDHYREAYGDARILNIQKECVDTRLGVSHREETKLRLSKSMKEKWEDTTYREAMIASLKEANESPETRKRRSDVQKIVQSRPGFPERKRKITAEKWADPETRARYEAALFNEEVNKRRSDSTKRTRADPLVKARTSEVQKIAQNRPEVKSKIAATNALPETKEKRRISGIIAHGSDEARQRNRETQLISQNRPEVKAKKSESIRLTLASEESRKKRLETNADPEVKKRRSLAAKACQARRREKKEREGLDGFN